MSRAERDARIYARRIEGCSLTAIGREFGLSPEEIQLIVGAMDRIGRWRSPWSYSPKQGKKINFHSDLV